MGRAIVQMNSGSVCLIDLSKVSSSQNMKGLIMKEYKRSGKSKGLRVGLEMILLGAIALIITGTIFLVGLYIFPRVTMLPEAVLIGNSYKKVDWSLLEGITSLMTFSMVFGGLLFAGAEYIRKSIQAEREAEARDAEIHMTTFVFFQEVFETVNNPDQVAARRWIIENLRTPMETDNLDVLLKEMRRALYDKPDGWSGIRPPGIEYLKQVLNAFDFIGFVFLDYWFMETKLVEWMSPLVAKVWERIYYYVEDEASRRNEPDYYRHAREFGDYCVKWRRSQYPTPNIIINAT